LFYDCFWLFECLEFYIHFLDDFFSFLPQWLTQSLIIRKEFLIKENLQWNPNTPYFQDIFFNLDLLSKQKNFQVKEYSDWIWRKVDDGTLSKKVHQVNTYFTNEQIGLSYWNALVNHNKNVHFEFLQFCLTRFFNLLQANSASKVSLFPLLAYVDIIKDKKAISWSKYCAIKAIAFIGVFSNSYNIYMGKQIFFRAWKKIILNNFTKPINNHFIIKGISVNASIREQFEI
jgi:hypothetical protein